MTVLNRCVIGISALVLITIVSTAPAVRADVQKCQRSIAKDSAKFAATWSKVLQKCEDKKLATDTAGIVCWSDPSTTPALVKANGKAREGIVKACCGSDRVCGNAGDESLAAIGWGGMPTCPNFEHGDAGNCNNQINHPGDVADCVICIAQAATGELDSLAYAHLMQGASSTVVKCQRAIGKETAKFYRAKSKALQKCWDARIKGDHPNDCPSPGDGKALATINNAESKKVARICKACGGSDGVCGGSPDLNPRTEIGFPDNCHDVTVPNDGGPHSGQSCAGAVLTMSDLVNCLDCVAEYKVDCVADLTVPQYESYPSNCNGG